MSYLMQKISPVDLSAHVIIFNVFCEFFINHCSDHLVAVLIVFLIFTCFYCTVNLLIIMEQFNNCHYYQTRRNLVLDILESHANPVTLKELKSKH